MPAEADHQRRHDAVAARGDDQLDARAQPSARSARRAPCRRGELAPGAGTRAAPRRRRAQVELDRARARSCAGAPGALSFSATARAERVECRQRGGLRRRPGGPRRRATPRSAQQRLGLVLGQPGAAVRCELRRLGGAAAAIARRRAGSPRSRAHRGGAAQPGAQPGRGRHARLGEAPGGRVVEQLGQRRGDDRPAGAAPPRRASIPSRTAAPRLLRGAVEVRGLVVEHEHLVRPPGPRRRPGPAGSARRTSPQIIAV